MKIVKIENNLLRFENIGNLAWEIRGEHASDCCEYNYADFKGSLDSAIDLNTDYTSINISKQPEGPVYGFDLILDNVRYPINCYSEQSGYYSSDLDVYLYLLDYNDAKLIYEMNITCQ